MADLLIKGNGDVREVYDGDALVGRIRRVERRTFRRLTATCWEAEWPSGAPVRMVSGSNVYSPYLKSFRRRDVWFGPLTAPAVKVPHDT